MRRTTKRNSFQHTHTHTHLKMLYTTVAGNSEQTNITTNNIQFMHVVSQIRENCNFRETYTQTERNTFSVHRGICSKYILKSQHMHSAAFIANRDDEIFSTDALLLLSSSHISFHSIELEIVVFDSFWLFVWCPVSMGAEFECTSSIWSSEFDWWRAVSDRLSEQMERANEREMYREGEREKSYLTLSSSSHNNKNNNSTGEKVGWKNGKQK